MDLIVMDIMGKQHKNKRYYKSIHCCLKFCCFLVPIPEKITTTTYMNQIT